MSVITYIAKREIATGHSSGTQYSLEFGSETLTHSRKVVRNIGESIGGLRETLLLRDKKYWDVKTDFIEASQLEFWREWRSSVMGGELFGFDPYGTISAPDNEINVLLDSETYRESRVGASRLYQVAFRVIF